MILYFRPAETKLGNTPGSTIYTPEAWMIVCRQCGFHITFMPWWALDDLCPVCKGGSYHAPDETPDREPQEELL